MVHEWLSSLTYLWRIGASEKYLKRNVSDEVQIKAFEMVADKKYTSVANSIIGMPDETRELIFDTINFVRKLPDNIDATGAFIFAPYHGTPLRTLAIEKGYLKDEEICSLSNTSESMLRMPTISKDEIQGIARVFSFYIKFPKTLLVFLFYFSILVYQILTQDLF